MEGQLVQRTFTIDERNLDCWIIKIDGKFWFKTHDIAVFLGYKDPDQAIRKNIPTEARQQWVELGPRLGGGTFLLHNWQPHTVFITEGGLYRLLCRSTKPEAIKFEKWVFDDVLPTLRDTN
jgi:prophage antirepressor-like protein